MSPSEDPSPILHAPTAVDTSCDFETAPLTRPEYLNVMVHFYRAEVARSTSWRERLDATTNWAVLTSAGMLSFTFASTGHSHVLLLLSNLIIVAFLLIEARRYRYFEVYRARVRMLEENFLLPIITRQLDSPMTSWNEQVARDLDRPKYKTAFYRAVGFRLRRNYAFIFIILLGGWLVKLAMHPTYAKSLVEIYYRTAVGSIPPSIVVGGGLLFYGCMLTALWFGRGIHGDSPTDEMTGIENELESWKL